MLFIIISSIQVLLEHKSEKDSRVSSCLVIVRMLNDELRLTIITSTDAMMEQILRIYGQMEKTNPVCQNLDVCVIITTEFYIPYVRIYY